MAGLMAVRLAVSAVIAANGRLDQADTITKGLTGLNRQNHVARVRPA